MIVATPGSLILTVGLSGVKVDFIRITLHLADGACQIGYGNVATEADVDVALPGRGVLDVGGFGQVHDMDAGGGHVVYIQEFATRGAGTPDGDYRCLAGLGFVEPTDQRRDNVTILRVVVVARAIQASGHDAAVVHRRGWRHIGGCSSHTA